MEEIKQGKFKYEPDAIIKDFQSVITISYVAAVGVGMLFNYKKYAQFGINIFDYADVLDFLIAPFGDVIIIFFTLISLAIVCVVFVADTYWERKFPQSYSRLSLGFNNRAWYSTLRYVTSFLAFFFYLYIAAEIYGGIKMKEVKRQPETVLTFSDNETERGIVIGKTRDMLFMLNGGKVNVIPLTSAVKKFEIKDM